MKNWFIIIPKLSVQAMALFPFILLRNRAQKNDAFLINHERIHLRQQVELLVIPFYFLYFINYLINLVKYKNHNKAYRQIVFEKEAYANDKNLSYLGKRKWYNWINFYSA